MTTTPPALAQARQLFQAGRADQARQLVQRFLQRNPGHAEANHSMAIILATLREREKALYFAERAVAAAPHVGDYHVSLASVLDFLGHRQRALDAAAWAATLEPGNVPLLLELVGLYWGMDEMNLALGTAEAAVRIDPTMARGPYASVLNRMGDMDRAITYLRAELDKDRGARDTLCALIQALNYRPDADPREVLDLHRRFGATFHSMTRPARPRAGSRPLDPDRRLRVGFISPDLYSQSVAFFAEPIIRHLDRSRFEVFCYSSCPNPDATTRRLQGLADTWRDIAGADDASVIRRLDEDSLDILVELAGVTSGLVLPIMAAKPAPVQVTAIGYPNTTGLPQIDYRVVDEITDPPGAEAWAVERLVRLPGCFLCYQPMADAPGPAPRSIMSDAIVFGSFNVVQKITTPVIETWTRLINTVPGSRLLLKCTAFSCTDVRTRYAERFRAAGFDLSRLELLPPVKNKAEHLAVYDRIDIGLDPFPYNGTTTTCEALFMGVPVVTLEGKAHAGRVGMSLLTAAGLPELIARTPDNYVQIAGALAGDAARLADLKRSLRGRLLASPLCDAQRYAAGFGAALREMWASYYAQP